MYFSSAKSPFLAAARVVMLLTLAFAVLVTVASAQTLTTIHNFVSSGDVAVPTAPGVAIQGRDGNLYGTTGSGGAFGAGGVYVVTQAGTESVLYSFPLSYTSCQSGLSLGSDGNLYGACLAGGTFGYGLLYKLTPSGTFTDLHEFNIAGGDGGGPFTPPVQAKDGNFYGTTYRGGTNDSGTVYKMTPGGTVTILHSFTNTTGDGTSPHALVLGKDGNLYGSSYSGGSGGFGVIFKISTKGKLTVLHSFVGTDGSAPVAAMIQGTDGNFYGTTFQGGTSNNGVVFKMAAGGKYTLLHNLVEPTDGSYSYTAMVQGTDGNFYGTTNKYLQLTDAIFKLTSKGVFSIVHQFDGTGSNVGTGLANALVQNTDGAFYGATNASIPGGGNGTIYTLDIGAKPFARLSAASGLVGDTVGIFGQGFDSSTVVKFDGVLATGVVLESATYLTAKVPAGALTGAVTVTTGATTLTSSQTFLVLPKLNIFTPPQGPVGTSVVIAGVSLKQATKVTFGGVSATFTVNSDSQITATVPAGATTGKIAVKTKGGSASSKAKFIVQ